MAAALERVGGQNEAVPRILAIEPDPVDVAADAIPFAQAAEYHLPVGLALAQ